MCEETEADDDLTCEAGVEYVHPFSRTWSERWYYKCNKYRCRSDTSVEQANDDHQSHLYASLIQPTVPDVCEKARFWSFKWSLKIWVLKLEGQDIWQGEFWGVFARPNPLSTCTTHIIESVSINRDAWLKPWSVRGEDPPSVPSRKVCGSFIPLENPLWPTPPQFGQQSVYLLGENGRPLTLEAICLHKLIWPLCLWNEVINASSAYTISLGYVSHTKLMSGVLLTISCTDLTLGTREK